MSKKTSEKALKMNQGLKRLQTLVLHRGMNINNKCTEFLSKKLCEFTKKVAVEASKMKQGKRRISLFSKQDTPSSSRQPLMPIQVNGTLESIFTDDIFRIASGEGNKALMLFENQLLTFEPIRYKDDSGLFFYTGLKLILFNICKKATLEQKEAEIITDFLNEILQDIAVETSEMCQEDNLDSLSEEDVRELVSDYLPYQLSLHALTAGVAYLSLFKNGTLKYTNANEIVPAPYKAKSKKKGRSSSPSSYRSSSPRKSPSPYKSSRSQRGKRSLSARPYSSSKSSSPSKRKSPKSSENLVFVRAHTRSFPQSPARRTIPYSKKKQSEESEITADAMKKGLRIVGIDEPGELSDLPKSKKKVQVKSHKRKSPRPPKRSSKGFSMYQKSSPGKMKSQAKKSTQDIDFTLLYKPYVPCILKSYTINLDSSVHSKMEDVIEQTAWTLISTISKKFSKNEFLTTSDIQSALKEIYPKRIYSHAVVHAAAKLAITNAHLHLESQISR